MLGVHVESGPSTQEIITSFERCEGWSRDDRKQLAYLAIFSGYIEGRRYSTPTRTRVINFVQKDIGEMFPKWEFDVEDTPAENIIKLMVVKKPWKWTMDCWEVTGTWVNIKPAVVSPAKKKVVKEDSPRPRKKGRKEAPAEASEEAAAEATVEKKVGITTKRKGTSSQNTTSPLKPTLEPGSESVNGTNEGRKSLAEDKRPDVPAAVPAAVPADASSSKDKAPEPILVLLDKYQPTVSDLQKEDARYQEKRNLLRVTGGLFVYELLVSRLHIDVWINVLRKRYDANPQHFRRERMCFLDHLFAQQWRFNFKDFKDSEPDQNSLGRKLPGGVCDYYAGTIPSFCQSNKVWGTDIDDIYAPVNYADTYWIVMWISIPKRHIVVFDSICSSISSEDLDVVMKLFLYMVPYLLVECASSDEQRACLEPFTYERPTNIPPARAGDCGVYTLKYIECHALGIEFSKKDFAKANGKSMKDKMAVDIFQELPDAHEFARAS
uniref:Ubiquitin-like protease family profile domain-containing protein n=1 Tax=Brassica oleracea var. oleracea TaxID=109376 RepID=A0A0D3CCL9_BRAOL